MNYFYELNLLFSQTNINVSERVTRLEASFDIKISQIPRAEEIRELLSKFPSRDHVRITLKDDNDEIFFFKNILLADDSGFDSFLQNAELSEKVCVTIEINKSVKDNYLSVYVFDRFVSDLIDLNAVKVMETFSFLFQGATHLYLIVFDKTCFFTTKTVTFSSDERNIVATGFNREKRLQECRMSTTFFESKTLQVLPDDFKLEVTFENNPVTNLFNQICNLLSMVYIASTSSIEVNQLTIQISGQRSIVFVDMMNNTQNNPELYKIYNWIYTEGNTIDKALIARNVLSLHCRYLNFYDIDELALASIQSNYNLYLRKNVTQYLELRNRIGDFISGFVSKTGEYASLITDRFIQNIIAILVFLFTIIIANIVSDQPLNNILTRDVTFLFEVVLFGSILFSIYSRYDVKYQISKIDYAYELLKKNYKSVLSSEEINDIFQNDDIYDQMKVHINKRLKVVSILWGVFIIAAFIFLEFASERPIICGLIKMFIDLLNV